MSTYTKDMWRNFLEEVKMFYQMGNTPLSIAEKVGVSEQVVLAVLKEHSQDWD